MSAACLVHPWRSAVPGRASHSCSLTPSCWRCSFMHTCGALRARSPAEGASEEPEAAEGAAASKCKADKFDAEIMKKILDGGWGCASWRLERLAAVRRLSCTCMQLYRPGAACTGARQREPPLCFLQAGQRPAARPPAAGCHASRCGSAGNELPREFRELLRVELRSSVTQAYADAGAQVRHARPQQWQQGGLLHMDTPLAAEAVRGAAGACCPLCFPAGRVQIAHGRSRAGPLASQA